jgi:4-hydroxy-tetrahydrodipicolinate synthase
VRAVASAIAPVPVILQYAPALTGTSLDAAVIARIARDLPNLVQVKVESVPPGAFITALAAQSPALDSVVGYAGVQLIDAIRRGAVGVQPGSSFVEIYLDIWSAWQGGREKEAIDLHRRLLPYISYWMQSVELIIAAEKRISRLRGLIDTERCRAPERRLDSEEEAMIDRFLSEFEQQLLPIDKLEIRP